MRNMATSLFRHERIETTTAKAKELRPYAERLITLARRGDLHSRRLAARKIQDRQVLGKLFDDIAPRFMERPGGYTRILKLGNRKGDAAEMSLIELAAAIWPNRNGSSTSGGKKSSDWTINKSSRSR